MERREERATGRYFTPQIPSGEKVLGNAAEKMLTAGRGWSWVWGYGLITPIKDLQVEATLGV